MLSSFVKRIVLSVALLVMLVEARGNEPYTLAPDSSNFVIASLVTATASDVIYSSMGHCALRLQCPTASLDYCFSLEMEARPGDYVKFFSGEMKAAVVAVPTGEFLNAYREEGRGVTEHELNLTHHEKQQLWRLLDEELVKPPHLTFNFLNTNCVMMSMVMIEQCLIDEHIDFGTMPAVMQSDNGDLIRYHSQDSPWAQFLYITLSGAACDDHYETEYRLSPQMIVEVLQGARIVSDSTSRPVFSALPTTLIAPTRLPKATTITPTLMFLFLLIVTIAITVAEKMGHWEKAAKILDIFLFAFQTLAGIVLIYTSTVANLFGSHWNWYLIPFNPLPLLLWLCFHRARWFKYAFLIYGIVLVLFILYTPFSSQLDLSHQLLTAILAVRAFSHAVPSRK